MNKPNYNRYSQVGNDAMNFPVGAPSGVTGREKGWRGLQFVPGTAPQVPEFNELQEILLDAVKDIGDFVARDGRTTGLQLRLNLTGTPKLAHVEWQDPAVPAKVYVGGLFHVVPQDVLEITGIGRETVAVQIARQTVTEIEDADLYNVVQGEGTSEGGGGAYRYVYSVSLVVKTDANSSGLASAIDLYQLQDGQLRTASSEQLNEIDANLVRYTANIVGDCITGGPSSMRVRVEDANLTELRVVVDRGTAYVSGREVGYKTSTPLIVTKAKFVSEDVIGEGLHSKMGTDAAALAASIVTGSLPIKAVDTFNFYTAIKRTGDFHQYPFSQNPLDPTEVFIERGFPFGPLIKVVGIYNAVTGAAIPFAQTTLGFRFTGALPVQNIRAVWVFNASLSGTNDYQVATNKKSITITGDYPNALNNGTAMNTNVDRAQYVYPGIQSGRLVTNADANAATKGTNDTKTTITAVAKTLVTSGTYNLVVNTGTSSGYKITYGTGTPVDNVVWTNGATVTVSDTAGGTLTLTLATPAPTGLPKTDVVTVVAGDDIVTLADVGGLVVGQELLLQAGALPVNGDESVIVAEILTGGQLRLTTAVGMNYANNTIVYTDADFVGLPLDANVFPINISYAWLLDRVDLVYIDADNNIATQPGQSNKPALAPTVPLGVLPLVQLIIPANGDARDVRVVEYPVRALTQQEIRGVKIALDDINYNAAIQSLKLDTYNRSTAAGLALRGLLTDPFVNSDTIDVNADPRAFTNVGIDPDNGVLHPQLALESLPLAVDTIKTTCFVGQRAAVLGHTLVGSTLVNNPRYTHDASDTIDVEVPRGLANPARPTLAVESGDYTGSAQGPESFTFLNVQNRVREVIPSVLEGGFWRTREQSVPWLVNRQLYLPQILIFISGRDFAPGVYTIAVDGQPVLDSDDDPITLTVVTGVTSFTNYAVTLRAGTVAATGARTISILGQNGVTIASTIYGVTPAATALLPIAHDSLAARRYVQIGQTFAFPRHTFVRGVNLSLGRIGTGWIEVQVRNTTKTGEPGDEILVRKRILANDTSLSISAQTRVEFPDVVFCSANTSYALVVEAADEGWGVKKAVVGHSDQNNTLLSTPPLAVGALYSSIDGGGWVIQLQNALTLQMLECAFQASANKLVFQAVSSALFAGLNLVIPRAQQLVPRGASVAWSYSLDSNVTSIGILIDTVGSLDPQALPFQASELVLTATLQGSTSVSGAVATTNARILAFDPADLGIYTTRAATSVPTYNRARITLALSALAGLSSLKVKFSTVDEAIGEARFTLSGVPLFNDQLSMNVDGTTHTFTYQSSGGSASLVDFTTRAMINLVATYPDYTITANQAGSTYVVTMTRDSASAFVAGNVTAQVVAGGGSTLAVSAVAVDYEVATQLAGTTVLDETYIGLTYELTSLTPAAVSGSYTFRVQLELHTDSPQRYPKVRLFAVSVSN